ncbi:DUF484 family protein [Thalassomonas sp. M1454]|uniref:DUF484 family protein n=1 Tax=Thalassomonas sp. M1454 TaxID=2594477 RepID=UPI00117E094E|nr:DUF484 family protein [Thalassomonas sp. M1454]TRX55183.1 DUF484 family protein [Thalassomonas sp. M1454]
MIDKENVEVDEMSLLNDELVITYLQDNPNFFNKNPQLLTSLRLADANRGVVSLVERQQQMQRQKIQLLEEEITQLLSVASYNEQLFTVYNDLYLSLIESPDLSHFLTCLSDTTTQLLNLASFKLYLTNKDFEIGHESIVKGDCSDIISKRFEKNDYYFGRIQQAEKQAIFADQEVGSVVLIQLSEGEQCLGFIAISSNDAEHFTPSMDTLLLNQFRTLIAKLLIQQLLKIGL